MDRLIALVLLRWRLELRGLRRHRGRLLALLLVLPGLVLFSLLTAAFVFVAVRALSGAEPDAVLPVLSAAATGVGLFWALSPVLAGVAFTESHDVSRLLHFPLGTPTLVASSLLANLLQPFALAELPLVLSLSVAVSARPGRVPFALAGTLLSFAMILAVAHLVGLALHGLARNRRFQDLALFLAIGTGFLLSLLPLLLVWGGGRSLGTVLRLVIGSDPFALSPFAWGVRAAVHGGRGDLAGFAALSGLAVLGLLAVVGASAALTSRIARGEVDSGGPRTGAAVRARMWLGGPIGALWEKDVRSAWRDPALKATLLIGLTGPVLLLLVLTQSPAGRSGSSVLALATFVGLSGFGANAFAMERRGLALLLGFPLERWRVLVAKNAAALTLRLPGLVLVLAAGLLLAPAALVPAAVTIVLCGWLVGAGMDNYASILLPVPVAGPGANPYGGAAAGSRGLGTAALSALLLLAVLLVASPFVFLAWLPQLLGQRWLWAATLPLALAGAAGAYALLVAGAASLLARREPELLEVVLSEA